MAQTTINPYEEIGAYIPTGLAAIIAALPGSPAIDDLVDAVYDYIYPIFYSGGIVGPPQISIELKSIARTCINSYVNNNVLGGQAGYNASQMRFITMLIGNSITANLPIVSIANRIEDVEDNISDNGLNVSEQTPLLLATTIGSNANSYWAADVVSGSPVWAAYYPPAPENYMDIPYYVEAAMVGALAGYGATPAGMVEPSVNFVTNKMVSALIGALTVTAGKVIFEWIPRIQHGLTLNAQTIANIGNGGNGSGKTGIQMISGPWAGCSDIICTNGCQGPSVQAICVFNSTPAACHVGTSDWINCVNTIPQWGGGC